MNALAAPASSGGSAALGIALIIIGIIAYWVPTAVAWIRRVPNAGSVTVLNLFLGWTVIAWVIALMMAVRSRPPVIQVTYAPPLTPWQSAVLPTVPPAPPQPEPGSDRP